MPTYAQKPSVRTAKGISMSEIWGSHRLTRHPTTKSIRQSRIYFSDLTTEDNDTFIHIDIGKEIASHAKSKRDTELRIPVIP
jgi:hypothetical protein